MNVVRTSRLAPLAFVVVVLGCSTVATAPRAPVTGLADLAGAWTGWLVTSRDTVPAVLDIDRDGAFRLTARRIHVVGAITVHEDGSARFEGEACGTACCACGAPTAVASSRSSATTASFPGGSTRGRRAER